MSKDIQIAYLEAIDKIADLEAKLADKIQKYQLIDDNYTRLSEKYDFLESSHELLIEENLKLEYQSMGEVYYQRFILGLWCVAERTYIQTICKQS